MADYSALSPVCQHVLHHQTISENEPGTVLRDFASLLDFVGAREVAISGKNQLLPMSLLLEPVNPKIRKPTVIEQRGQAPPQYPNFDDDEDWDEE